jgi:hypothetical protein
VIADRDRHVRKGAMTTLADLVGLAAHLPG